MKNITEYNEFKNMKRETAEPINEGAQLFDDQWKVRLRIDVPTSVINAYVKKVQAETGEDPRKKWSEQELAEELANYVSTSFMTVENLPTTIVTSMDKTPTIQSQEEMPAETQVQAPVQEAPVQEPAPVQEFAPEAQGAPSAQSIAQEVPAAQAPAQAPQSPQAPTAQAI